MLLRSSTTAAPAAHGLATTPSHWVIIILIICHVICVVPVVAQVPYNSLTRCNDELIITSFTRSTMRLEKLINDKLDSVNARFNQIDATIANIETDINVIKKDTKAILEEQKSTNGGWSLWTPWTDCSTTCGKGQRARVRQCDNPQPSTCGRPCIGSKHETESCNHTACPIDGCLAQDGFFKLAGTPHCYKVFGNTELSWEEAKERCTTEGYRLAEPAYGITLALRKELISRYGNGLMWLGGKGDGMKMNWQNQKTEVGVDTALWVPSDPGSKIGIKHCLSLLVHQRSLSSNPTAAYFSTECENPRKILCEVIAQ